MGYIDRGAEEAIVRLAGRNGELVARSSLLEEGVAKAAIDRRVRSRHLRLLHPGVYFTGHGEPNRRQFHHAAVMACGEGAALRRLSASELWRMLAAHAGPPEVLHSGPRRRGPAGVALARTILLAPTEITVHHGTPVTTPARTLLDLAATDHPALDEALHEAQALRLVRREELEALAGSGRHGAARLRALLSDAPGYTRQGAERHLRSLILKAQLPRPEFNARLDGRERDAVWARHRLVLEVDGYAAHGTRDAFERDRRRDQELAAAGYRSVRLTWRQLTGEPEAVVARLAAVLAQG